MPFLRVLGLNLGLDQVDWKRVAKIGGVAAIVVLIVFAYLQHVALEKMEFAYKNPAIQEHVITRREIGPVRIVTRTIQTPGRTETVHEEFHDPIKENIASDISKTPVFAPRQDRWLVGGTLIQPLTGGRVREKGLQFGYSFENRLDILGGVFDGPGVSVGIVVRF